MISYVIELVTLFEEYKHWMFGPALNNYQKNVAMNNTVSLADKLYIAGDMPDTNASGDIMNPDKNLCAIVSLYELASSGVWAQYGEVSSVDKTPISLSLWTADPLLRESIHVCMMEFFQKNGPAIVTGKTSNGVNWELDRVQSYGFGQSPDGLYQRSYTLWMRSIWIPS